MPSPANSVARDLQVLMRSVDDMINIDIHWTDEDALSGAFHEMTHQILGYLERIDTGLALEFDRIEPSDHQLAAWRDHPRGERYRIAWMCMQYHERLHSLYDDLMHSRFQPERPVAPMPHSPWKRQHIEGVVRVA